MDVIHGVVTKCFYKNEQGPYGNYAIEFEALHTSISSVQRGVATPSNLNLLSFPRCGEIVRLEKSPTSDTSENNRASSWKYTQIISTQGQKSDNINGDVTTSEIKSETSGDGANISESTPETNQTTNNQQEEDSGLRPLQPYEGDIIFEGRRGNSIRFGCTIDKDTEQYPNISDAPSEKGSGKHGDPILIIRNGQKTDYRDNPDTQQFINENINHDGSSLYLTSTQKISLGKPSTNDKAWSNQSLFGDNNFENAAQAILSSDRVVISSQSKESMILSYGGIILSSRDSVTLDSGKTIEMSAERIGLGVEGSDTEPAVLGDTTEKRLDELASIVESVIDEILKMQFGTGVGPTTSGPIDQTKFQSIKSSDISKFKQDIAEIKSELVFLNKTAPEDGQKDPDWGSDLSQYNATT